MKSLLEKQEIGEAIIENVLISVFYSLHRFKEGHQYSREVCLYYIILLFFIFFLKFKLIILFYS